MRAVLAPLAGLSIVASSFASVAPASAANGMSVTVGPADLTARVLVNVPVTVVCDPLLDPTLVDSVTVTLRQASGQSVNTGSGSVTGGPFSMQPSKPPFLTCDGTTANLVVVSVLPDAGSGPFHGGQAIATVSALHSAGTCMFPGFCQTTGSESAQVGPAQIRISG